MFPRREAAAPHFGVEQQTVGGIRAAGLSSNQRVPHEQIRLGNIVEQFERVAEVSGIGESAEVDQAAGGECVVNSGGSDHLGVDLLKLVH